MNFEHSIIKLKDNQEFLVIETVEHDGKTYLYLVNKENEADTMFVEATETNIKPIDPELFQNTIFSLFINKLSGRSDIE